MSKLNYSGKKAVYIKVCRESCWLCKRENKHTDTRALMCLEGTCEIALAGWWAGLWRPLLYVLLYHMNCEFWGYFTYLMTKNRILFKVYWIKKATIVNINQVKSRWLHSNIKRKWTILQLNGWEEPRYQAKI